MFIYDCEYEDFLGNRREKKLMFNLTETEINVAQLSEDGGYSEKLERLSKEKNPQDIISEFRFIVLNSYGELSEDGTVFEKSEKIKNHFECSAAYNAFFMKLISDQAFAEKFIRATLPTPKDNKVLQDHLKPQ